ncbi:hypothetical protein AOLI_G00181380 [Acnodon oligacanthus]
MNRTDLQRMQKGQRVTDSSEYPTLAPSWWSGMCLRRVQLLSLETMDQADRLRLAQTITAKRNHQAATSLMSLLQSHSNLATP